MSQAHFPLTVFLNFQDNWPTNGGGEEGSFITGLSVEGGKKF